MPNTEEYGLFQGIVLHFPLSLIKKTCSCSQLVHESGGQNGLHSDLSDSGVGAVTERLASLLNSVGSNDAPEELKVRLLPGRGHRLMLCMILYLLTCASTCKS